MSIYLAIAIGVAAAVLSTVIAFISARRTIDRSMEIKVTNTDLPLSEVITDGFKIPYEGGMHGE